MSEPTITIPDRDVANATAPKARHTLIAQIRAKPVLAVVTVLLFVLLLLDLFEKTKVDGWVIALIFMAILPWSLPTLLGVVTELSDVFTKSNLRSIQIGDFKIEQLENKVNEQAAQLDQQRKILDDLALYSMAFYIYDKLKYLTLGTHTEYKSKYGEYRYVNDEAFNHDLRYLRDHGYLELFQIGQLVPGENLVGKLIVTEMGRRFVELKEARVTPSMPLPKG